MSVELDRLAKRLRVTPAAIDLLEGADREDVETLDTLVAHAMDDEDKAFDAALEDALRFIPRLLRGPAQKLLFPGGRRG
jgi:hypothetical protein